MFGLSDVLFGRMKRRAEMRGHQAARKQLQEERNACALATLDGYIGKMFICVSNEWDNPVVGKLLRYDDYGADHAASPESCIPVIDDYVRGEIVSTGGIYLPYTEEMLRILVDKMNPYERWSVLTRTGVLPITEPLQENQREPLLTATEIIDRVNRSRK